MLFVLLIIQVIGGLFNIGKNKPQLLLLLFTERLILCFDHAVVPQLFFFFFFLEPSDSKFDFSVSFFLAVDCMQFQYCAL